MKHMLIPALSFLQLQFLGALIPAVASIGGALIGAKGQKDANEGNLALAREQMAFNSEEARKSRMFNSAEAARQRDWEGTMYRDAQSFNERMSSTAYRRAVADLSSAGLNPMLAYTQGSASAPQMGTPSGATASAGAASAGSAGRQENVAAAAMSSAAAALQLDNLSADAELKRATANRENASAGNLTQQTEKLVTADIPKARKEILLIEEHIHESRTKQVANEAASLLSKVQAELEAGRIQLVDVQTAMTKIESRLKELDIPMAAAMAGKWKSEFGKDVSPYLRDVVDILKALVFGRMAGPR